MLQVSITHPFSWVDYHVFLHPAFGWFAHGGLCSAGLYTTVLSCHEAMPNRRITRCRGKCSARPPALPRAHSVSHVQLWCLVLCVSLRFCVDSGICEQVDWALPFTSVCTLTHFLAQVPVMAHPPTASDPREKQVTFGTHCYSKGTLNTWESVQLSFTRNFKKEEWCDLLTCLLWILKF